MGIETFLQDLRFGARMLRRSPAFTAAAVVALALGVGATTAVFTVLDQVVLRPLPYPDSERLVMLWETNDIKSLPHERLSPVNFGDYRGLTQVFDDSAAWWYPQVNLTEPGHDPMRVSAVEASANFFSVIRVSPIVGSDFSASPLYSRDLTAVISHRLWQQRFGGDPAIVGKAITLSGEQYTVAGVMPPGFQYPNETDIWQRLAWDMTQHSRSAHFMEALVRLKPTVTIDRANTELRALTTRLGREHAATNADWHARVVPLSTEVVGFFRPALFALFGAAAFLLVITCTNVASLLLARATVREREVAVRAAIGASRSRLVRQFLTESAILAGVGTALGVAVATITVRILVASAPMPIPRLADVRLDVRVLAFAAIVAAMTAIAFGIVPAVFMARGAGGDIQRPLKEGGRGSDGGRRALRSSLVVAEVAIAVMLLVGASLLARSFERLVRQDPGFSASNAVTVSIELPYSYSDWRKIANFYSQLLSSVRMQPAVTSAGVTTFLPLEPAWRIGFLVDGRPRPNAGDAPQAQHQAVDEDYFRCLGVPLVRGRFFDARDAADTPGVVIINEALARREWPGEDPVGRSIVSFARVIGPLGRSLMDKPSFQVIGVVGNVKNASLVRDSEPSIYYSFRQFPFRGLHMVVRGQADPVRLVSVVRSSVAALDPNLPLSEARTLDRVVGEATDRPRALMMLMGVFAALALTLAALGIYSVLSYAVSQRRQELSVRLALGAQPMDLLWLVVRQGLTLTLLGGIAGAAGALALGRTLSSLLFGVSSGDAVAFAAAIATAGIVSIAACVIPARRAAMVDPVRGLRAE